MELVESIPQGLEYTSQRNPLAAARLQRKLTVEETAKRAGLTADQVEWLEEGRVYRFPSPDTAIEAMLLLASALDIDRREARSLAGLRVPPRPLDANPATRLVAVAALSAAAMALVAFVFVPAVAKARRASVDPVVAQAAMLPKPWKIQVDVLNGAGDINWTRQVAAGSSRSPTPSSASGGPTASTTRRALCTTPPAGAWSPCASRGNSGS